MPTWADVSSHLEALLARAWVAAVGIGADSTPANIREDFALIDIYTKTKQP